MDSTVNFFERVGQDIPADTLESRKGLTFLNWARALELAGNPANLETGRYGSRGTPFIPLFGGFVVGVTIPLQSGRVQTTWLPITDTANKAVVDAKELTDGINRCKAKAIACVTGVGMSLYAGYKGNAQQYMHDLALTPASDLGSSAPLTQIRDGLGGKKVAYLDWTAALTAAKITDPDFYWEVVSFGNSSESEGYPLLYCPVGLSGHALVGVSVRYKGREHTEYLAITGGGVSALTKPTVSDWNRTVMRALAKAIAICTGYGYGLYSKEDVEDSREVVAREEADAALQKKAAAMLNSKKLYPEFAAHAENLAPAEVLMLGKIVKSLLDNPEAGRMLAAAAHITNSELSEAAKAQGLLMVAHVKATTVSEDLLEEPAGVDPQVSLSTKEKALAALKREPLTLSRLATAEAYVRQQHSEHALTDNDLAELLATLQGHRLTLAAQAKAEAVNP